MPRTFNTVEEVRGDLKLPGHVFGVEDIMPVNLQRDTFSPRFLLLDLPVVGKSFYHDRRNLRHHDQKQLLEKGVDFSLQLITIHH